MAVDNDRLTLSEIGDQDREMHKAAMARCRDAKLDTKEQCHVFINELFGIALKKMGFTDADTAMPTDVLKKGMERHGIKDELDDGKGKDDFAAGIYLYKHGDLAYFISRPMRVVPHFLDIKSTPYYLVRTNV